MSNIPLRQVARPPKALAASGDRLEFFGMRSADLETWKGIRLTIDFCVMSVSRPILSAGRGMAS
eukprot:11345289-Heterocapsa_arctica.AAC.1